MDAFFVCSALIIGLVVLLCFKMFNKDRITRLVDEIPGPPKLPIIGTAHMLMCLPKEELFRGAKKRIGKYGPIFRSWMGTLPVVHFTSPETLESVLSNSVNITKNAMYTPVLPWLGDGLLTSTGDRKAIAQVTNSENNEEEENYGVKKRKAFLDLFPDMAKKDGAFTDTEIQEQVDTFMFEGHDTTTAGICWSLFLLGNHPDIQEQVFEEIDSVFEATGNKLTVADLGELKLLERCIKEALRLYPSVPIIGRTLTEDVQVGQYTVPAGCSVNLHIFLVHRNDEIFPDPEKFDPDRFLPENSRNRHPYAYVPFSAGARNCIGQKFAMFEEKTVLAYILRNYEVTAMQNQDNITPMMELILRPKDGLLVTLERRQNKI